MNDDLWDLENPITDYPWAEHVNVPDWIESDISPSQVAAIVQGGCGSGAYMPAVTYYRALRTMERHGDEILDYIADTGDAKWTLSAADDSWAGLACTIVSTAVEIWAYNAFHLLEEALPAESVEG